MAKKNLERKTKEPFNFRKFLMKVGKPLLVPIFCGLVGGTAISENGLDSKVNPDEGQKTNQIKDTGTVLDECDPYLKYDLERFRNYKQNSQDYKKRGRFRETENETWVDDVLVKSSYGKLYTWEDDNYDYTVCFDWYNPELYSFPVDEYVLGSWPVAEYAIKFHRASKKRGGPRSTSIFLDVNEDMEFDCGDKLFSRASI